MAGVRRVAGGALIGIGVLLLVVGAYYVFHYEATYFEAVGVTLLPGQSRPVLVVPGSRIVITSYSAPLCEGGKLVLYDSHGIAVWESGSLARTGGEDVVRVSTCHSSECTFHMQARAPPDCSVERVGSNAIARYTLYVRYKPEPVARAGEAMLAVGAVLVGAGALAAGRRPRGEAIPVGDALLELARKPRMLPSGGGEVSARLTLKPKGIGDDEVSKLVDVIAEKKAVKIEADRPRFSRDYSILVKGPQENVDAALRDFTWFCQATGKCEAAMKSL